MVPQVAGHRKLGMSPQRSADVLPLSRPQAVRLLGLSDRTFARLEAEGIITATRVRAGRRASTFDGYAVVRAYLAHRKRQLIGSNESPRDRRDKSQAELNELKLARERRTLLPREQVVQEGRSFVIAATAKIRALPRRLVQAGLIARTAEPDVAGLLSEAQQEIARWSSHIDLLEAAKEAS
jgi:hypothetical protein